MQTVKLPLLSKKSLWLSQVKASHYKWCSWWRWSWCGVILFCRLKCHWYEYFQKVIVRPLIGGDFSWRALNLLLCSLKWIFTCPSCYLPPVPLHPISSPSMLAAFFCLTCSLCRWYIEEWPFKTIARSSAVKVFTLGYLLQSDWQVSWASI